MTRLLWFALPLLWSACASNPQTTDDVAVTPDAPDPPRAEATPRTPASATEHTWTSIHGQTIEMNVGEMLAVQAPRSVLIPSRSEKGFYYSRHGPTLIVLALAPGVFEVQGADVRVKVRDHHAPEKGARILERYDGQSFFLSMRGVLSASVSDPSALSVRAMPGGAFLQFLPRAAGTHHAVIWGDGKPQHFIFKVSEPGVYPPSVKVHTLKLGGPPYEINMRDVTSISTTREAVKVRIAGSDKVRVEPKAPGFVSVTLFQRTGEHRTMVFHVTP